MALGAMREEEVSAAAGAAAGGVRMVMGVEWGVVIIFCTTSYFVPHQEIPRPKLVAEVLGMGCLNWRRKKIVAEVLSRKRHVNSSRFDASPC